MVGNTPSVLAAKAATTTVPIVFVTGGDPVDGGLVASLNRPGSNLTGVSFLSGASGTKRLVVLRLLVPNAVSSEVGWVPAPNVPQIQTEHGDLQGAACA